VPEQVWDGALAQVLWQGQVRDVVPEPARTEQGPALELVLPGVPEALL
jgi:hypothetical protein